MQFLRNSIHIKQPVLGREIALWSRTADPRGREKKSGRHRGLCKRAERKKAKVEELSNGTQLKEGRTEMDVGLHLPSRKISALLKYEA